jgi:hypothetical protein
MVHVACWVVDVARLVGYSDIGRVIRGSQESVVVRVSVLFLQFGGHPVGQAVLNSREDY